MVSKKESTPAYVVVILSMRPRWLRRHPESARLRLRVLPGRVFERIKKNGVLQPDLPRKFRRWVKEEGFKSADTERQAWKHAYSWKADFEKTRRKVDLKDPGGYRVYAFQMNDRVWGNSRFAAFDGQPDSENAIACCYVGMTASDPRERYKQHRSMAHRANTKWGREFFLEPFETAYRLDLLNEFEAAGFEWEGLSRSCGLITEEKLAQFLQRRNIAAYFA